MERWLLTLRDAPVEKIVCVLASANQSGTRRNPLEAAVREQMLEPSLRAVGKPFVIVRSDDVPEREHWVKFVADGVERALHARPNPGDTQVFTQNRDVAQLFLADGFQVTVREAEGTTPLELITRLVDGRPWESEATEATREVLSESTRAAALKALFTQRLLNDDGELGHLRDFSSYGAQMDASLQAKLDDLLPWVKRGRIVDKGCGTGKLLVELSKRFPTSSLVGVDLSHEFLRQCDENTYANEDVTLVFGNVIEKSVPDGSASTVIFSSVTHEIYSYTGYSLSELQRSLVNAAAELEVGGHVLVRDGISPPAATWRMKLLNEATRETFVRFAAEFKHGEGAKFERLAPDEVRLSAHLANEFLCKKDYLKNWHIEVHEEYGALTLDGWRDALDRAGFEPISLREYVNPWIAEHRYAGTVALTDDAGVALPWPATNAMIVGRKR